CVCVCVSRCVCGVFRCVCERVFVSFCSDVCVCVWCVLMFVSLRTCKCLETLTHTHTHTHSHTHTNTFIVLTNLRYMNQIEFNQICVLRTVCVCVCVCVCA